MAFNFKNIVLFSKKYIKETYNCRNSNIKYYNWWRCPYDYKSDWFYKFIQYRKIMDEQSHKKISFFTTYGERLALKINKSDVKIFYTAENIHALEIGFSPYKDNSLEIKGIDLALGFDFINDSRYFRFPYWIFEKISPDLLTLEEIKKIYIISSKKKTLKEKYPLVSIIIIIITYNSELVFLLDRIRSNGQKNIFTNGCFDVIHSGHIFYLQKAKKMGDVLILGLNSDHSVKRLKGENRPVNNETDKAFVLSALSFLDYIVIFEEDTPLELIRTIQPDVLVKGGDYQIENIVGKEYAKETRTISFVDGYSSSDLIKKLKNNL